MGASVAGRGLGPRGPEAVSASLFHGLDELGHDFSADPARPRLEGATVGVLSDLDALAEAIEWRRDGRAQRLLAGPNLVVLPSDARDLMTAPEIDLCLVPSEWVKKLYEEDSPELRGRVTTWPAGVDHERWRPGSGAGTRRAIVYVKDVGGQRNPDEADVGRCADALHERGFEVTTLRYGTFKSSQYRMALAGAELLVFYSPTESQCLALAEAWACDVPSLVWASGRLEYKGRVYHGSSAPYLSAATGMEFRDSAELEALLDRWDELRGGFGPRRWILDHMTDSIAADAYWRLAHPAY